MKISHNNTLKYVPAFGLHRTRKHAVWLNVDTNWKAIRQWAVVLLVMALGAGEAIADVQNASWKNVSNKLETLVSSGRLKGVALEVYNRHHEKVFSKSLGNMDRNTQIVMYSASKWISAATIMTLVDQGILSLDDTTGMWLKDKKNRPWKGPKSKITLRQLLSFTSGLPREVGCENKASYSMESCSQDIYLNKRRVKKPGSYYDYGSSHMVLAGRMAENATKISWGEIFRLYMAEPLSMDKASRFYARPKSKMGKTNPWLAGGFRSNMADYQKFLMMIFDYGSAGGKQILSRNAIAEMEKDQFLPDTRISYSPLRKYYGLDYHYGLGVWRECGLVNVCDDPVISSPGATGWTPWIGRNRSYYAMLGVDSSRSGLKLSVEFMQEFRDDIHYLANAIGR